MSIMKEGPFKGELRHAHTSYTTVDFNRAEQNVWIFAKSSDSENAVNCLRSFIAKMLCAVL
jgi:hypothetical protein